MGKSKNLDSNNFDKKSKNSNFNIADLNETKSINEINDTTMKKIAQDHTLNINNLDENKPYEDCLSALEFFIISLSKNLKMKPRQSVALLPNIIKLNIDIENFYQLFVIKELMVILKYKILARRPRQ